MYMEIWKRFLMARNELFKAENETLNTVDELFMKAVHTVRELITEDNSSLTFYSELENPSLKSIGTRTTTYCNEGKQNIAEKINKKKIQSTLCKKK